MKKALTILALFFAVTTTHAQNAKVDSKGNYTAISGNDSGSAKPTGKTFTDAKGTAWPVYISVRGKLFYIRTSKAGNTYKAYLKL